MNQNHTSSSAEPLLSARNVSKSFDQVEVLTNACLDFTAGEKVAIMGPSGSGKSTLLHCLSGVLTPNAGEVIFDGHSISGLKDRKRSHLRLSQFGFVFQDGQLLPELSARENVALPLMLTGTSRSRALRTADSVIGRFGLVQLLDRRPGDMSGVQAQRIAVARAMVGSPRVVFADEPTGAVDQASGHEVLQLLTTMCQMTRATLIIVTHDVNVARWCSRLVEIRDGLVHSDRPLSTPEHAPQASVIAANGYSATSGVQR